MAYQHRAVTNMNRARQLAEENRVLKHDMQTTQNEVQGLKEKLASARATIRQLLEDKHGVRGRGQDFTPHERDWIQERLDLVDQREADYQAEIKKLRLELEMAQMLLVIEERRGVKVG